jgi:CheY-like chemotaxis protein
MNAPGAVQGVLLEVFTMANQESSKEVLHGWKAIARYLNRGLRTAQRWELQLGLPVRRSRGTSRSPVMAMAAELDAWLASVPAGNGVAQPHSSAVASPPRGFKVLVVEDNAGDVNTCMRVLRRMGASQVDVATNIPAALRLLSKIADGTATAPDVMVLDLAFSTESGFDVLRYWKSNPALRGIRVVVWTEMDRKQQAFCNVFGVERVVPKWAATRELAQALSGPEERSLSLN